MARIDEPGKRDIRVEWDRWVAINRPRTSVRFNAIITVVLRLYNYAFEHATRHSFDHGGDRVIEPRIIKILGDFAQGGDCDDFIVRLDTEVFGAIGEKPPVQIDGPAPIVVVVAKRPEDVWQYNQPPEPAPEQQESFLF
ncbi:MAG: hypothetical protein NTV48_00545 [Candidatus Vogelbacteria bacterium]|nr:hypothetical protein [Candidatus Vogelbacteria bacterium]